MTASTSSGNDGPTKELASVTLNVSLDVSVLERCFRGDAAQQQFDASYFNNVVAKFVAREASVQYAKAVSKLRVVECKKR